MSQKTKVIDSPISPNDETKKYEYLGELIADFEIPEPIAKKIIFNLGFNESDMVVLRSFNPAERKLWVDFIVKRDEIVREHMPLHPLQIPRWAIGFFIGCLGVAMVCIVLLFGFIFGGRH